MSFQPRNWFEGASIFTNFSHGTWGGVDSLEGSANGCSHFFSLDIRGMGGTSVETEAWLLKNPPGRAMQSKMILSENGTYCSIIFCSSKGHGQPGLDGLAFLAQYWRACAYATVFSHCSSQRSQQENLRSGGERKSFWWIQ